MTLRSLIASRGRLLPDLYVQRSPQQRERAVSFDPAEAWLDVQQGRGENPDGVKSLLLTSGWGTWITRG